LNSAMQLREIESLRREAAVHEAGHAIVAWTLGLKVRQLRIGDDGSGASCIECSAHIPILHQIAVAEAGMAAVELLRGGSPRSEAGLADAVKIGNLLDGYPTDQHEQLICDGHKCAKEILVGRLTALTDLSDALARFGLLDTTALLPFACV
jgi:hypothetical protein